MPIIDGYLNDKNSVQLIELWQKHGMNRIRIVMTIATAGQ